MRKQEKWGVPQNSLNATKNNYRLTIQEKITRFDEDITFQKRYNEGKELGIPEDSLNRTRDNYRLNTEQKITHLDEKIAFQKRYTLPE